MSFVNIYVHRERFEDGGIKGSMFVCAPFVIGRHETGSRILRCATFERHWTCNRENDSSIPPTPPPIPFFLSKPYYEAFITDSIQYVRDKKTGKLKLKAPEKQRGWRIELKRTWGRTDIQIHFGMDTNDSAGCILIGKRFPETDDTESRAVRNRLKALVDASGGNRATIRVFFTESPAVKKYRQSVSCPV